jgi:hypothetical protein
VVPGMKIHQTSEPLFFFNLAWTFVNEHNRSGEKKSFKKKIDIDVGGFFKRNGKY